MKKLILSIIFANIALISVNAAPCKVEHNCYIQGTGSLGWHTNSKLQIGDLGAERVKQKKGFGGAIAIGYIIDSWRIELEGSHRRNLVKLLTDPEIAINSNTSLMVNVYQDIPVTDLLSVYVGAGAGFSSVNGKTVKVKHSDSKSIAGYKKKSGHHLDTVAAGQLMAGLTYKISDNVDLCGGYRLFATTKPTFKMADVKVKQKNIPVIQSVETGLRFKF